jgi:hypothetical protein
MKFIAENALLRAKYTVCCSDIASYKASYTSFTSKNLDEGVRCFFRPNTLRFAARQNVYEKRMLERARRVMMTSRESLKRSTHREGHNRLIFGNGARRE